MSALALILLGGIVALGFLGNLFFERTRIPDVLFLIGAGLLLGPVFALVAPGAVRPAMPYFGALALVIILFDGGLDLELSHLVGQAGRALLLLTLSFGITLILIYPILGYGLQLAGIPAWTTAAALSCTSAPILIPILGKLVPKSPVGSLLTIESSLSDALAVILVLFLLDLESVGAQGAILPISFLMDIGISLILAVIAGWLWLWILSHFSRRAFFSFLTVGYVFLLVGIIEILGGSGAVAALVFGVTLANGEAFAQLWGRENRDLIASYFQNHHLILDSKIREAQSEISLLVRTFFFVYIGIIFHGFGFTPVQWLTILCIFVLILAARFISVSVLGHLWQTPKNDKLLMNAMISRGLATAVLAAIIAGEYPEIRTTIMSLAFVLIILTNLTMTLMTLFIREKVNLPEPSQVGIEATPNAAQE